MPSTRSATRAVKAAGNPSPVEAPVSGEENGKKRKAESTDAGASTKSKRAKPVEIAKRQPNPNAPKFTLDIDPDAQVIPAKLAFSFDEAKAHLIAVDNRFKELFDRVKCKPFQDLEPVDPFRTLVISILGQQISWLAARSIVHKFRRLFDSSLPEKAPQDGEKDRTSFPSPQQVAEMEIATLRTAGLSLRKAEYVMDLAKHFQNGRLSAPKLAQWSDEDMEENLISVRGIGKVLHMFAIFSLRRPDILPVGDLGLQKGLLRWVISSHRGMNLAISPKKLPNGPGVDNNNPSVEDASAFPLAPDKQSSSGIPEVSDEESRRTPDRDANGTAKPIDQATVPHTPDKHQNPTLPSKGPVTPIKAKDFLDVNATPVELPEGLTLATLKARFDGKKNAKKQYLSPEEMDALTSAWAPYRSLACYYLWALSEQ
ncbi:hypothetical protein BS47DRAFT_1300708 [Hydnum rufescens UP504]|uniref:HhH-GPD domain-containing protein n=1 Tax=Hydnum rufescens UP504 TaxID=1448309 RepID=A0A9P6DPI5_9AGAM|nr:hypothetical protein BS47DRAFT_1300708 [Hydnum rufescens UP504]